MLVHRKREWHQKWLAVADCDLKTWDSIVLVASFGITILVEEFIDSYTSLGYYLHQLA